MSGSHPRLRAWLALLRPANCLTAAADVAAGWALAGAPGFRSLALLAIASMFLYAGGIALNDVCDAKRDACDRPERPIPSGKISRTAALVVSTALLGVGVSLALAAGLVQFGTDDPMAAVTPAVIAAALVLAIVLYNMVLRRWAVPAAGGMGACRGLNLLLGVSANPAALAFWWPAALGHVIYIAGVTFMARHESTAGPDAPRRAGVALASLAALGVFVVWLICGFVCVDADGVALAAGLALFAIFLAPRLITAWRNSTALHVRRAVTAGVVCLVLFDAAIAAGFAGWAYGLGVAMLAPIAVWLGRRFAVT